MTLAHRCAVLIVAGLLLSGCSAAEPLAASPPTSMPSPGVDEGMPTLIDDEWDVVIRREFPGDDGPVTCSAHMRVTGDDDDALAASAFLKAGDWSSVEVSLDDYEEQDLDHFRRQGSSDASLLLKLITDRVNQDLVDAGLFTVNVSVETETRC